MRGKLGDGRQHAALVLAACILDREHRQVGLEAGVDQLRGDMPGGGHAHIDQQRVLAARERGQIEMLEARLLAASLVARQEGHGVGNVAMGQRDLQAGRRGDAGGDAGHDLDGNAFGAQRIELLAATAEDERVAAFEANHGLAGLGALRSEAR